MANDTRKLSGEAVAMAIIDHQRNWPWPTAAGEPPSERRQIRHKVQGLLGALDRRRHGVTRRATLHLQQSFDGIGPARTGRESVNGLGRQRNQLAFGERLNSTMNDVTGVVGITKIDNNGRHRQAHIPRERTKSDAAV